MRKMKKLFISLIAGLVAISIFAGVSKATTANDLKDYICSSNGVGDSGIVISNAEKAKVERFFQDNTVTDEQADQIKAIIDKGIALMKEDGVTDPNKLSTKAKKEQLLSYAREAAGILGFTVSYDASEERLDLYKDGKLYDSLNWDIVSSNGKLVQTGSTNYGYVVAAGALVVAGATLVIARKKIADARA